MLLIILDWMYILLTTFAMGFLFSKLIAKKLGYEISDFDAIVAIGFVAATVYAQFFSLIYKVGLVANLILIAVSLVVYICNFRSIVYILKEIWRKSSLIKKIIVFALIILWSYFTSRGYMHYDSDLYHGQSIRWIEEYGIIKGLGNLQVRYAYNSSIFAVSALYSMRFLGLQSLHAVNGFIALLLSICTLRISGSWKNKKLSMTDFARLGAIYYLFLIYDEILAPASDFAIMCTVFYIVIKWLELLEKKEQSIQPYALLCIGGVFAVSLKLTAGLILILVIKPAYQLIRQKKVKEIFIYIITGFVTILPWFLRNIVISGYLIYPFAQLDLFDVGWKISKKAAIADATEIKAWGKGLNNVLLADTPLNQWLGGWFNTTLSGTEKLIIIADVICVIIAVILMLFWLVKKKREQADNALVLITVIGSYVFWQLSAPLMRYGYAYTLLVIMLLTGILLENIDFKVVNRLIYVAVVLFGVVKLIPTGNWIVQTIDKPYYVTQQDYGKYAVSTYEINGVTFYYPTEGDQLGYDAFPGSATWTEVEFLGKTIREGFKTRQ